MSSTIHREAVVGPDGTIEVSVPELEPGQHVSIIIQPEQTHKNTQSADISAHIIDLVKDQPGGRLFKTADEVDEYLRQERDSWDR